MKEALGLAVCGNEIRLAHLTNTQNTIRVTALETAYLKTPLDEKGQKKKVRKQSPQDNDGKNIFGLKEDEPDNTNQASGTDENMEVIFKLVSPFVQNKIKVGMNIPMSLANYQRLDHAGSGETFSKEAGAGAGVYGADDALPSLMHRTIDLDDGRQMSMSFEENSELLKILRSVNGFIGNKLFLNSLETSEMALINMVRASALASTEGTTVVIAIEDKLTRLIFMNGSKLLHISPVIHENASSPKLLEVISRKILFEQDELELAQLKTVLLTGRCNRIRAQPFFAKHFRPADVHYLHSDSLGQLPTDESQNETFSEYAVAIGLAWKQLQPQNAAFYPFDLLPRKVKEEQELFGIDWYSGALLGIAACLAFIFTWKIVEIRGEINEFKQQKVRYVNEISINRSTVDTALNLEAESRKYDKSLAFGDSLSTRYDEFLVFLQKLNSCISETGNIWVDEISKNDTAYVVKGASSNRKKIPIFAESLGRSTINTINRDKKVSRRIYRFDLSEIGIGSLYKDSRQVFYRPGSIWGEDAGKGDLLFTKNASSQSKTNLNPGSEKQLARERSNRSSNQKRYSASRKMNDTKLVAAKNSQFARGGEGTASVRQNSKVAQAQERNGKTILGKNKTVKSQEFFKATKTAAGAGPKQPIESGKFVAKNVDLTSSNATVSKRKNAKSTPVKKTSKTDVRKQIAGKYAIQVASSYSKSFATRFIKLIKEKGFRSILRSRFNETRQKTNYIVLIGPYSRLPEARNDLKKAKKELSSMMTSDIIITFQEDQR